MAMKDYCKRMLIMATMFAAVMFTSAPQAKGTESNPKREMRSVWMSTAWAIDWPTNRAATQASVTAQQKQALEYIEKLYAAGFNAVYFQVRPFADRFYAKNSWTDPKSGTTYKVAEPWSAYLTGTRGKAPYGDWDPLQFWIDECHKRGMELHAWVNPYRIVSNLTTTSEDTAVSSWTITYASKTVFNPALSQTIARIQNVCRVLTGNYDIDGIVFDDYFYPDGMGSTTDTAAPDYANYQTYKSNGGTLAIADWRRDNVNRMVEAVCNTIHDIKPYVQFGISPAGAGDGSLKKYNPEGLPLLSKYCKASDWAYASLACDPIAWLRAGTVDYISPQLYWRESSSTNAFTPMSKWWSEIAKAFNRHFYASHSESWLAESGTTEANINEAAAQVKANRNNTFDGNFGSVFYSAKNVITGLSDNLGKDAFKCKAVAPAMTWKKAQPQGRVSSLARNKTQMVWDEVENMRYICYAIPQNVYREEAVSETGGLKAEYIMGVTYTNSFTFPADKADSDAYWHAVSVLDRYGNEYELTTINEPYPEPGVAAAANLIYPADMANIVDNINFCISAPDAENVVLEISTEEDFSVNTFRGKQSWVADANDQLIYKVPLAYFTDGQYFWRVRTMVEGCDDGISETRSFVVGNDDMATTGSGNSNFRTEDSVDPDAYNVNRPAGSNVTYSLSNMWMHRPGSYELNIDPELTRDMVARSADDQYCDIVYIAARSNASAHAESFLLRYDAQTGHNLPALQLTYDEDWANGTYPCNGILLDDANQLVTHSLSVAGTSLSVGTVDPVTGFVTTWYNDITEKRVDHLDVIGTIGEESVWAIFAPTNAGTVYRITMKGRERVAIDEMELHLGNAARIHAIDYFHFWANGQQTHPAHYVFGYSDPISAPKGKLSPLYAGATDMLSFEHDGESYLFYQYGYANESLATTSQWALAKAINVNESMLDAELLWVFPAAGAGDKKIVSGDFGAPVSIIQHKKADYETKSLGDAAPTYLYGYSYGQGLVAYSLNKTISTSAISVNADGTFKPEVTPSGCINLGIDTLGYEVYSAAGQIIDAGNGSVTKALSAHGIYMVRAITANGTHTAKIAF